jgi:integrase/recombinase XerD
VKEVAGLPRLLQAFFTERLMKQRSASPHTIAAYRDTFRLLLRYAADRLGTPPSRMRLNDLDPALLTAFLEHLEKGRRNTVRTRNARLAAIHAFFRYVALNEPSYALLCQRILAIPSKRFATGTVSFLTAEEAKALTSAPSADTWIGRRDRLLLLVAVHTGLRVSELISLSREDVTLGKVAPLRCQGKGRKTRATPLRREVALLLDDWLRAQPSGPNQPVFPSVRGGRLSIDGVELLVSKHVSAASRACPSLGTKRITPHTLRHTTAMELLRQGVDRAVIALWLGHESIETTQIYLHADMRLKEQALNRTAGAIVSAGRFKPSDSLLTFLEGL